MAKDYQRLWKDVTNAKSEAQCVRVLAEILADQEGRRFVSYLGREDAALCIEILDRGILKCDLRSAEKHNFFTTLRRLVALHGRLPGSILITERIEVPNEILASGGFADVRCGNYQGHRVAVRALRVTAQDDISKIKKQFCKEVVLWNTLLHPNILKLVGVQGDMKKGHFITISEWMKNGNIMEYIKNNHVNRLELLHGAAQGLEYLHSASLTHGDLKGANILMSNDTPPRACLADFGFMSIVFDPDQPMSCSAQLEGGTMIFLPPELLAPQKFGIKHPTPTQQSDVYAFGLVVFQVLTGELPFRGFGPAGYIYSIVEGLRPAKPGNAAAIGFSDQLWAFAERCWDANWGSRPRVPEIVACLSEATANWNGVMPPHVKAEYATANSRQEISDSMKHFNIFGGPPDSDAAPRDTVGSSVTSAIFSKQGPPSTQYTEPPRECEVSVPNRKPRVSIMSPDEPRYLHLKENHKPPPSLLPKRKWTSFKFLKGQFRKFFGLQ